ncbi:MAG TPA: TrmH family RNA methyltransferase [Terriglobales bacterium]|nr:TrmH family RNA methyltransferase [Terriglobales bacterium]
MDKAKQRQLNNSMDIPAVVIIDPKYPHNVGAAIRACACFEVKSLIWTGERVNPAKYSRLPRQERMKGYKHVDFRNDERPFELLPKDCAPVCVEVFENSEPLTTFEHPENAAYVFGPEDGRVPQVIRRLCHRFLHIPAHFCLNLSAAINVVLAHRLMSRQLAGKTPILPLREMLVEVLIAFLDESRHQSCD